MVATIDEPHFLVLNEGDYVDVLEWQADKSLAVCRTADERIGFYSIPALKSEEEIFAGKFMLKQNHDCRRMLCVSCL